MRKSLAQKIFLYIFLSLATLIFVFPLYWTIVSSFKPEGKIFSTEFEPIPKTITLVHYRELFSAYPFFRWFLNSVLVSVSATTLGLVIASMASFALAAYRFRGRDLIFAVIILSLSIPEFITIIPLFTFMSQFGAIDSLASVFLPLSVFPLTVFLMREYIVDFPADLYDSARIDGCSEFAIYYRILLPIIRPIMAAAGIQLFMRSWNNLIFPLIMLQSSNKFTFTVGIPSIMGLFRIDYGVLMAGAFLSSITTMIVFLGFQRQFVAGLTKGSIKA